MSERPRIVVVGAGLIGRKHIETVAARAQLAAVVDVDPDARKVAARHGAPWFAELGDALQSSHPDGAIIATPNQLHAEQAVLLAGAGVPVLIEKPVADTVEAAARILACEASGARILVGHHRRHSPIVRAARDAIAGGRIGRIVAVGATFLLYKPEDYFAPEWRRRPGAGPVFINLVHDVDLLRHFCGDIVAVQAMESRDIRGFGVEDTAAAILRFQSGALGTVLISDTAVAPWSWEFTAGENPAYPNVDASCYTISGTHGSLSVPDMTLWSHPGARGWWQPMENRRLPVEPLDPIIAQFDHFVDVIAGRAEPLVTAADAAASLAVVEEIKRVAARADQP